MAREYTSDDPWRNAMVGMGFLGNAMRTGQQIGETRYQQDDRDATNKAYEYIAGKLGSSGDLSALDGDSILNTRHGVQAMGKFMLDRANTEQSRLSMLKNMTAADDQFYQNTFRPMAFAAQEAYQSGDMRKFGQIVSELSAKSPLPYKYELGQDGNFAESFRSSKEGKFIDTGERMSPRQVFEQLNGIMSGEQRVLRGANMQMQTVNPRFLAASARYKMGTILGNAQALSDPNQWIPLTKGGKTIYVIPQNRHDDYSVGPSYRVVDDKDGMGGMVGSLDDLMSQGWVRADVKAKIDNAQRIAAGRGVGGAGGSGGMAFNLTDGDMAWINKMSTTKDDMGNETYHPYVGMSLEILMGKHGLTRNSAFAAYDDAVTRAISMAKAKNPNASESQLRQMAQKYIYQQLVGGGPSQKRSSEKSVDKPGSKFTEFGKQVEKATKGDEKQGASLEEDNSPQARHARMVEGLTELLKRIPSLPDDELAGYGWQEEQDPFEYEPFRR